MTKKQRERLKRQTFAKLCVDLNWLIQFERRADITDKEKILAYDCIWENIPEDWRVEFSGRLTNPKYDGVRYIVYLNLDN